MSPHLNYSVFLSFRCFYASTIQDSECMGFISCFNGLLYFYICNLAELLLTVGAMQVLVVSPELCIRKNVVCGDFCCLFCLLFLSFFLFVYKKVSTFYLPLQT